MCDTTIPLLEDNLKQLHTTVDTTDNRLALHLGSSSKKLVQTLHYMTSFLTGPKSQHLLYSFHAPVEALHTPTLELRSRVMLLKHVKWVS